MLSRDGVEAVLALIGASLNIEVPQSTTDAWMVLVDEFTEHERKYIDDENFRRAAARVLKEWDTTFFPPFSIFIQPAIDVAFERIIERRRLK